jgi:DNA-binding GntR family transcriptional regulator
LAKEYHFVSLLQRQIAIANAGGEGCFVCVAMGGDQITELRNELDEHREIKDAAVSRDADAAVEVLMEHYRFTADIIRD